MNSKKSLNLTKKILTILIPISILSTNFVGCSNRGASSGNFKKYNGPVPKYYKVKRGDTVSKIARRFGLDWRDVARINGLDSNHTVYINQNLKLKTGRNTVTKKVKTTKPESTKTDVSDLVVNHNRLNKPTPRPVPGKLSKKDWLLPTSAVISDNFDLSKNIKGMRFTAALGEPIFASQDGQVIYANNGLKEYGNLILIRHSEGFITAYAHNHEMLVKEGDRVKKGNNISTMGKTGSDRVMLEFQVRKGGKAVDPRRVLD